MELLSLQYVDLPNGWQNLVFKDFKAKFEKALPFIQNGGSLGGQAADMQFGVLYSAVYSLCCQPPHVCKALELFDFFKKTMRENWMSSRGEERDKFIKTVSNIFLYIERFYAKRFDFETLSAVAHEIMDEMTTWRRLAMKTAFRRWSLDEEMMGQVYAEGGKAHKRSIEWWENEQHKCKRQKKSPLA